MSVKVTKSLLTMEDVATGTNRITQHRGGTYMDLTEVDLAYPVNSIEELKNIDYTRFTRASLGDMQYRYDPFLATGDVPVTVGSWVRSNISERFVDSIAAAELLELTHFDEVIIGSVHYRKVDSGQVFIDRAGNKWGIVTDGINSGITYDTIQLASQVNNANFSAIAIVERANAVFVKTLDASSYPDSAKFQDSGSNWWVLDLANPYLEHLGAGKGGDDVELLRQAVQLSTSKRVLFRARASSEFIFSDTVDFSGFFLDAKNATFKANFDGKEAVILGGTCRISNMFLEPTDQFSRGLGYPDLGNASTPRDTVSHGYKVVNRSLLNSVQSTNFKGHGFAFEPINSNDCTFINLRAFYCNHGFYFGPNTNDNLAICNGDLRAYGNGGCGVFCEPTAKVRHNTLFIRSESNNNAAYTNIDGFICDTVFDDCLYNDLVVYSEGTAAIIDFNIYCTDSSIRNSLYSLRQDRDRIQGTNATLSGNRLWQNTSADTEILDLASSSGNVFNSYMNVRMRRAAQDYGYIRGVDNGIFLSKTSTGKELGVTTSGVAINGRHTINYVDVELTSDGQGLEIPLGTVIANTVLTGEVEINLLNSLFDYIRRIVVQFTSTSGTVRVQQQTDLLTGSGSRSSYIIEANAGQVVLKLTAGTGFGSYIRGGVKYQVQRIGESV